MATPDGSNPRLLWDFDGYFMFLASRKVSPDAMAGMADLDRDELRRLGLIHFFLRSSLVLTVDADKSEREVFQEWSRLALKYSLEYGPEFAESDSGPAIGLPVPGWVEMFDEKIKAELRESYPVVDEIRVVPTLEPRLYARSFPGRKLIHVSVLTREYLRSINLQMWNYVFAVSENKVKLGDPFGVPRVVDVFFPFMLSLYRDVNFSLLPVPRAYGSSALLLALATTQHQLTFMLAHEYAHVLLHDDHRHGEDTEAAADAFAYDFLYRTIGKDELGDLWTAMRWFYRLLALERIVGSLLYGGPVDWDQDEITGRSFHLMQHVGKIGISAQDNALEMIGTAMLMTAKTDLAAMGGDLEPLLTEYLRRTRIPY